MEHYTGVRESILKLKQCNSIQREAHQISAMVVLPVVEPEEQTQVEGIIKLLFKAITMQTRMHFLLYLIILSLHLTISTYPRDLKILSNFMTKFWMKKKRLRESRSESRNEN